MYADQNLSMQACHIPMVKSPNYQNKIIAITQKNNTTTCVNLLVLRVEISLSSFSILCSAKKKNVKKKRIKKEILQKGSERKKANFFLP